LSSPLDNCVIVNDEEIYETIQAIVDNAKVEQDLKLRLVKGVVPVINLNTLKFTPELWQKTTGWTQNVRYTVYEHLGDQEIHGIVLEHDNNAHLDAEIDVYLTIDENTFHFDASVIGTWADQTNHALVLFINPTVASGIDIDLSTTRAGLLSQPVQTTDGAEKVRCFYCKLEVCITEVPQAGQDLNVAIAVSRSGG
jgi:hypothetical protein